MIHEILRVGMLECNCSIFGDETTREGIVIDPGDNVDDIMGVVRRHGLKVQAIVITHAHIDHIGGAQQLKAATGAPVYMNPRDQALCDRLEAQAAWLGMETPDRPAIDAPAREGDSLLVGAAQFHFLATPGHTQGSMCLWLPSESKLIAGDTLFRESIGRTDLPGGDGRQILVSIREKLWPLADDTTVIPGHGPNTTIGHEKEFNPFVPE